MTATQAGATLAADAVRDFLAPRLAGYKLPRDIRFEPIPKTSTGKIQKFQLRERASRGSP